MLRQPRAVWAVAFACVIAFMGIGLVDPILKPIADELGATPPQASLLFTSYVAVMGVAMLSGPLLGGWLGSMSWRAPFVGVAVLMSVALVVTAVALPATPRTGRATSLAEPLRALRHRGLLVVAATALLYTFGFFILLAFTPFPLDLSAREIGLVFFGWGVLLAVTSVLVAPWLRRRFGTVPAITGALVLFALTLGVMAAWTDSKAVLIGCVVFGGAVLGVNNTLITEAAMSAAPVGRGVASAAYSFLRFGGGAVAAWLAGWLGESVDHSAPYWLGAAVVAAAALVILAGRRVLAHVDAAPQHGTPAPHTVDELEAVTVGDA